MTVDRERTLQVAQSFLDAGNFEYALGEFQKIIQVDPNDTRVLLKIGDLQVRARDYVAAIATYEKVADFYAQKGFALKAIAVYKQIRELVQKHAPARADHYAYVVDRLTRLYQDLGLLSEALQTLDEEASWLRSRDREQDAVSMYRRMTELSPQSPLPHLRLAEGLCRVGRVDEAMESFWTAAESLLTSGRPDDSLRVIERMLHFKLDARVAKVAARIYLDKGTQPEGMQALSRLQICFQADPKDVETLGLLAEAFEVIDQGQKAFEVRKEIARQAHEQGHVELFKATLDQLRAQAPDDHQVHALTQLPPPKRSSGPSYAGAEMPVIPRAPANPRIDGPASEAAMSYELETIEELEFLDDSGIETELEEAPPASTALQIAHSFPPPNSVPASSSAPVDGEGLVGSPETTRSPSNSPLSSVIPLSLKVKSDAAPDSPREPRRGMLDAASAAAPTSSPSPAFSTTPASASPASSRAPATRPASTPERIDAQAHTKRALADAASFRDLRLVDKAIETIQVALEFDPQSIRLRESLRDLYVEQGDRDAAIEEMLTMAAIYIEYDRPDHAQTVLENVLEAVPDHPVATRAMSQLMGAASVSLPAPSSMPPASSGPLPRFEQKVEDESGGTVEDALEEAEFFTSRGLLEDALLILRDQLDRAPGHPLLLEGIREIEESIAAAAANPSASEVPDAPFPSQPPSQPATKKASSDSTPASRSRPVTADPDDDFDIKSGLDELERAVRESQNPPAGKSPKKANVDVDKVFEKFKARVRSQVSDNDSATHYDLGVAYKEMRLFGDAIEELKMAGRNTSLECNCYSMIGLIYAEQEEWDEASKAYNRALSAAKKTVAQEANVYYDLGHAHEKLGRFDQAAYYFQQVLRRDASFRDTRERIADIRNRSQSVAKPMGNADDELDRAFEELLGD